MVTINERRLLNREWVNMQPAVVAYREQCIRNMSSHERHELLKKVVKLTECRKVISEAQKHSKQLKYFDDENEKARAAAAFTLRESWDTFHKTLASVRRSTRLSVESKAIIAVDFIATTEDAELSRIAMKVVPDNVLFSWTAFHINAPDSVIFDTFSERGHISFALIKKLQTYDNHIRRSKAVAAGYEKIVFTKVEKEENLLEKINVLLFYIDYVKDFYEESGQRATEILGSYLEPFKKEYDIGNVPDDWAIIIAQQIWKEPEQQ